MNFELECPVDFTKINENKVRLTALWVLLIAVVVFLTKSVWIAAFLALDFAVRGFEYSRFSLLNQLSDRALTLLKIPEKPIDRAPKVFAAKIGLGMTALIGLLLVIGYPVAALVLTGILLFFALLESAFRFCAGCYVYTLCRRWLK